MSSDIPSLPSSPFASRRDIGGIVVKGGKIVEVRTLQGQWVAYTPGSDDARERVWIEEFGLAHAAVESDGPPSARPAVAPDSTGPLDYLAYRHPVSIKGVLVIGGKVVLLKNEREEWELPGGKLDPGEQPRDCLTREMAEELSVAVEAGTILDSWLYTIDHKNQVVVITYGCRAIGSKELRLSHEHKAIGLFAREEVAALMMSEGYKASIRSWFAIAAPDPCPTIPN